MLKSKLDPTMTRYEVVSTMAAGCSDLAPILLSLLRSEDGYLDISLLDMMGIRGFKLERFINDCCQRSIEKFNRTMMMIRDGVFEENEIIMNLNFRQPIPFIDDNLKLEGTPSYDKDFPDDNYIWNRFCDMQHSNFQTKFHERLMQVYPSSKQYCR